MFHLPPRPAFFKECTEKTTLEEWGGVYMGVRAVPAPPYIPVLFPRLTFFQWSLQKKLPSSTLVIFDGHELFKGCSN